MFGRMYRTLYKVCKPTQSPRFVEESHRNCWPKLFSTKKRNFGKISCLLVCRRTCILIGIKLLLKYRWCVLLGDIHKPMGFLIHVGFITIFHILQKIFEKKLKKKTRNFSEFIRCNVSKLVQLIIWTSHR